MARFCTNCGAEIKDGADVCLECGANVKSENTNSATKKNKKMPTWLIVILVILFIGIIGGALGDDETTSSNDNNNVKNTNTTNNSTNTNTSTPNSNNNNNNNTASTKKEDFSLENGHHGYLDDAGFAYYIEGYITNNTNKEYSYVQVTFKTYDSDGNSLGNCMDNITNLDANGRWKFKAMCLSDVKSIASYKLDKITKRW